MPQFPAKAISNKVVITPPSLMSWPADILRSRSSCWVASHAPCRASGDTSGVSSPTCSTQKPSLSPACYNASHQKHYTLPACLLAQKMMHKHINCAGMEALISLMQR